MWLSDRVFIEVIYSESLFVVRVCFVVCFYMSFPAFFILFLSFNFLVFSSE